MVLRVNEEESCFGGLKHWHFVSLDFCWLILICFLLI